MSREYYVIFPPLGDDGIIEADGPWEAVAEFLKLVQQGPWTVSNADDVDYIVYSDGSFHVDPAGQCGVCYNDLNDVQQGCDICTPIKEANAQEIALHNLSQQAEKLGLYDVPDDVVEGLNDLG